MARVDSQIGIFFNLTKAVAKLDPKINKITAYTGQKRDPPKSIKSLRTHDKKDTHGPPTYKSFASIGLFFQHYSSVHVYFGINTEEAIVADSPANEIVVSLFYPPKYVKNSTTQQNVRNKARIE